MVFPVIGGLEWFVGKSNVSYSIAVGSPRSRFRLASEISQYSKDTVAATLVHPRSWIGNRVSIGAGTVVCAGTAITTDIEIQDHVILNLNCTVGHDTVIESFVTAAPTVNISGGVRIGLGAELGTSSTILQNLAIGEWSVVGGAAAVVKDVPANAVAVGIPAKVIKELELFEISLPQ